MAERVGRSALHNVDSKWLFKTINHRKKEHYFYSFGMAKTFVKNASKTETIKKTIALFYYVLENHKHLMHC